MQQKKSFPRLPAIHKRHLPIVLGVMVGIVLILSAEEVFRVKAIEVYGTSQKNSLIGLPKYYRQFLPLIDDKEVAKAIKGYNTLIKSVKVEKQYPDRLQVIVTLYKPSAYFQADGGYFAVSGDGRILFKTKEYDQTFPLIRYYQKYSFREMQSGEYLSQKDIATGLHFLASSLDLGLRINTIDINGLNMIALQLQDKKILFTTEKDITTQDYQLGTILRQFKIEGKDFKILDLRFEKPIIQFTQS